MKLQQIVTYKNLQLFQKQRRTINDYRVYYCKNYANKDQQELKIKLMSAPDNDSLIALDDAEKQINLKICRIGQLINTHIFHNYFELTNQMPKSNQPLNCLYIIEKDDGKKSQTYLRPLTSLEVCYLVLTHLYIAKTQREQLQNKILEVKINQNSQLFAHKFKNKNN